MIVEYKGTGFSRFLYIVILKGWGELRKFCLISLLILTIVVIECLPVSPAYALSYTVDAPDDLSMTITYVSGGNSGVKTISFSTDDETMSSVKVEVLATNGGYLQKDTTPLSTALVISGTGLTTTSLTGTNQTLAEALELTGTGVKTASVNDMVITQPAFTPVASGNYTATIIFAVTFN